MVVNKPGQNLPKPKASAVDPAHSRGPIVRRQSRRPSAGEAAEVAPPAAPREDAHGVVCVCPTGDVVLDVQSDCDQDQGTLSFRVSSRSLVSHSVYFQRLLEDTRFAEGSNVATTLEKVRAEHGDSAEAPSDSLPHVHVAELGRISPIKSIRPIFTDLLLILHNGDLPSRKIPLTNLANLVIVADRFDSTKPFADWIRSRGVLVRPKALSANPSEEALRQRLLLGLLLQDTELVLHHSRDLIVKGSPLWDDHDKPLPSDALWWDLPSGIEEELQVRRGAVLSTIWSLLRSCLESYTRAGARVCRLGYDSSPACDSFQLGEFTRFLARAGFLAFASGLDPTAQAPALPARDRDVAALLAALRTCPSYQLDAHHAHCGPRKALLTGLAAVDAHLSECDLGICLECWTGPRAAVRSWADVRPAPLFDVARMPRAGPRAREAPHFHRGAAASSSSSALPSSGPAAGLARDMFTASEHTWAAGSSDGPPVGVGLGMRGEWASVSRVAHA